MSRECPNKTVKYMLTNSLSDGQGDSNNHTSLPLPSQNNALQTVMGRGRGGGGRDEHYDKHSKARSEWNIILKRIHNMLMPNFTRQHVDEIEQLKRELQQPSFQPGIWWTALTPAAAVKRGVSSAHRPILSLHCPTRCTLVPSENEMNANRCCFKCD